MPQNFYEFLWIFIIYAFVGWCVEVAYAALDTGKFVNRGFLNGPYCPIYGFGVVIVIGLLTPLKDNLIILFFGSTLLTTALEFVAGYILEKVFHNKWWDYSNFPFNVKGYICLKFSIIWGFGCTFIMDIFHPIVYKFITWIPFVPGVVILVIFMSVFLVDCGITVSTILKLNKRLKAMDEVAKSIHKLSDEIGENIYENVSNAIGKSEEFKENHPELLEKIAETKEDIEKLPEETKSKLIEAKEDITDKRKQLEELKESYEKLFEEKSFGFKRLIKAFPDMISKDNNEMLEQFKMHFDIMKKKKDEDKDDKNDKDGAVD